MKYPKAVGTHIVILVDRKLQQEKNVLSPSGLIPSPMYEYMQYNLQYGKILSVGEGVKNSEIKPGRLAIIHHTIESDDKFLIDTLPNGDQVRWLNSVSLTYSYSLFGVMDTFGNIFPLPEFVFCNPEVEVEPEYQEFTFAGEKMRFETEQVGQLYLARVPQKQQDTKRFLKPTIAHVATGERLLERGMNVMAQDFTKYPITLLGREYWILSREFIISHSS